MSEQEEAQKSWWELEERSPIGSGSRERQAVVHGWITLGARGTAGPASKAGEVVKAGPALVLWSVMLLRGLTDHVFEESWTKDQWWPLVSSSNLDERTRHFNKYPISQRLGSKNVWRAKQKFKGLNYLLLFYPGLVLSLSWQQSPFLPEAFLWPFGEKPSLEPQPLRLCHLQAAGGDKHS